MYAAILGYTVRVEAVCGWVNLRKSLDSGTVVSKHPPLIEPKKSIIKEQENVQRCKWIMNLHRQTPDYSPRRSLYCRGGTFENHKTKDANKSEQGQNFWKKLPSGPKGPTTNGHSDWIRWPESANQRLWGRQPGWKGPGSNPLLRSSTRMALDAQDGPKTAQGTIWKSRDPFKCTQFDQLFNWQAV